MAGERDIYLESYTSLCHEYDTRHSLSPERPNNIQIGSIICFLPYSFGFPSLPAGPWEPGCESASQSNTMAALMALLFLMLSRASPNFSSGKTLFTMPLVLILPESR